MPVDIARLQTWIGKTETRTDQITIAPIAALSATFDRDDAEPRPGDPLPPLWHWLYFLPRERQSELAPDGHAHRGGFVPPVPLPRRMWAGNKQEFYRPLRVGETVTRQSKILDVRSKEGRTGPLVFVRVRHEIGDALVEEHEIAYRDKAKPGDVMPPATPAPSRSQWERTIQPDDVLLFRYSALTFNGHRIHYDRRYATEVEGYPGLVVHGPLIASLLADLLRRSLPDAIVTSLTFRAMSPLFDTAPFTVCGQPEDNGNAVRLWARNAAGGLAMDATATLK
ncbi:MAG TPA: MaoC family dehydratase N-terminal domain-containing protein [Bryobacteraceae bacterium]|nr:MaoC family dehydratase N-terminal domain-containing protein [Bryobacteraceae bacterium]